MSATTDPVITSIDGALRDWHTSQDAMRWNPDLGHDRHVPALCDPSALADMARAAGLVVVPWQRRIIKMASEFGRIILSAPVSHGLAFAFAQLPEADRRHHRRHCATCNPAGNPRPLGTRGGYDMAEYRRRTRARRRRR